jgi:hypothetical protein
MAATQTVFLKHTFIGKSSQDQPYTARAHSRYIQRESATHAVYTHLMPESYKARQRWFYDHENGLRANGRTIDKFTISIPHEISQQHAAQTLFAFGKWLGQERAPFMFTLQGFDTNNHHAHFIFIDRDYESGKRIYGTTERNSTRGIKLEWEKVANEQFAELGYDVRVQVKDALQAENDNATIPETEDTREGDDDMAAIERQPDYEISAAGNDVRLLASTVAELNYLRDAQARLEEARDAYSSLIKQREDAEIKAGAYEVTSNTILQNAYAAKERLGEYQRANGKLKGFRLNLFGYELKTETRRQAESALQSANVHETQAEMALRKRQDYKHEVEVLSARASAAERDAFMRKNELAAAYGTDAEVERAESAFTATIDKVVQSVPFTEAQIAYEEGELTPDEYRIYLELTGNTEALEELDEQLRSQNYGAEL